MNDGAQAFGFVLVVVCAAGPLSAQCNPQWWDGFGTGLDDPGDVRALAVFNDGRGPALYIGGDFALAGGHDIANIARWDGLSWEQLGGDDLSGPVHAMTVFDDGTGPALYVGGLFESVGNLTVNNIARWDGSEWAALGSGVDAVVHGLTVFDDGNGAALFVGGSFSTAGGLGASRVAKWDGSTWSALGSGISGILSTVWSLAVFDDGENESLFVGGLFSLAGGQSANNIAQWNGFAWSPVGGGTNDTVLALHAFNDGTISLLYVGGNFTAPAARIAAWDGFAWSALGEGTSAAVFALGSYDDSTGVALYAGGSFTAAGGVGANRIAKWKGGSWSSLGRGTNRSVLALAVFDDCSGPDLYAGGDFTLAGNLESRHIGRWLGCREITSAAMSDFSVVFGSHLSGGLAEIQFSDNQYLVARSKPGLSSFEPNVMELVVGFEAADDTPVFMDVWVESHVTDPAGSVKVRLKNWSTSQFDQVSSGPSSTSDETILVEVGNPAAYVEQQSDRAEVSLRYVDLATFSPLGFDARVDRLKLRTAN